MLLHLQCSLAVGSVPQLCLLIWSCGFKQRKEKHMHALARAILNEGGRGALQSKKQEAEVSARKVQQNLRCLVLRVPMIC